MDHEKPDTETTLTSSWSSAKLQPALTLINDVGNQEWSRYNKMGNVVAALMCHPSLGTRKGQGGAKKILTIPGELIPLGNPGVG